MAAKNERYITPAIRRCGRTTHVIIILALGLQLLAIADSSGMVPTHWGITGEADSYVPAWQTLIFWAVLAAVITLDELLAKHLDVKYWNRPNHLAEDRLESWYFMSMRILFSTNLIISLIALAFALMYLLHAYDLATPLVLTLVAALFANMIIEYIRWKRMG